MCFQGQLVSMWQELSQSELSLNQQLSEFYDTLLSSWHSQLLWSSQVKHASFNSRVPLQIWRINSVLMLFNLLFTGVQKSI